MVVVVVIEEEEALSSTGKGVMGIGRTVVGVAVGEALAFAAEDVAEGFFRMPFGFFGGEDVVADIFALFWCNAVL